MAMRRRTFVLLLILLFLVSLAGFGIQALFLISQPAYPPPRTFVAGDREVDVLCPDHDLDAEIDVNFQVRVPWLIDPIPYDPSLEIPGQVVAVVTAPGCAGEVVPAGLDGAWVDLSRGEDVTGLVLDLYGEPIVGARVLHPHRPPYLAETRTDEQGRFRFPRIVENAWVRAEVAGFAPLDLSLSLYPEEGRDLVFYLVKGRAVAGQVVDSGGRGVSGAVVSLDQEAVTRIVADAQGRFAFDTVLTDWEVLLQAHAKGLVGPVVNALAGETDVELTLYRPAEIRGQVLNGATGRPVEEFEIRKIDGENLGGGIFVARGLLPGEHRIEVRAGSRRGEATVDVREGESRSGLILTVRPDRWGPPKDYRLAHSIEFVLTESPHGGPAEDALIRGSRPGEEMKTGPAGRAAVRLLPGEHLIRVGSAIGNFAEVEVLVNIPQDDLVEVAVTRNPRARLEFQGGAPEPRSKLWLRVGDEMREHEFRGDLFAFTADRKTPISVFVKARGYLPALVEHVLVPASGVLEIALPPGAFIRGRCLGAGGHPLPKVVAEVQEHPLDARMETLGDGIFKAGALLPGNYRFLLYARNVRTRTIDLDVPEGGVDLGDMPMLPPCDLHILVVTSSGMPVEHALVETSILVAAKAATDASGRVVLPGTNAEETLRVGAPGFLDTWHEIVVPDETRAMPVTVTLYRPARLLLRTVDPEGKSVDVVESDGPDLQRVGPGTYVIKNLHPGPLKINLTGREGRKGQLQAVLSEGEERAETVILR